MEGFCHQLNDDSAMVLRFVSFLHGASHPFQSWFFVLALATGISLESFLRGVKASLLVAVLDRYWHHLNLWPQGQSLFFDNVIFSLLFGHVTYHFNPSCVGQGVVLV